MCFDADDYCPYERFSSDCQLEDQFEKLKEEWQDATWMHSSNDTIMEHEACREIVKLGPAVVPFILEEIKRGDYWIGWSLLMSEITGISPDDTGANTYEGGFIKTSVTQMALWWLDWASLNEGIEEHSKSEKL